MSLLQTKKLTKLFGGVHAVDRVDVSFDGGKITALVGPNGSGKTTLINAITGMSRIDGGEVVVSDSVTFKKMRPSEISTYGITRTFQNIRLIQQMTVLDNILVVLTEHNVWDALFERHGKYHMDASEDILKRIGLWEKRHEHAENLSYGQRKLLEIARAVSMKAKIYFFDESFAGLFPKMIEVISGILQELKAGGAAVVLVEHDMRLVRELADYCYVLDSGRIISEGTPEHVLKQANVVEAYLGK